MEVTKVHRVSVKNLGGRQQLVRIVVGVALGTALFAGCPAFAQSVVLYEQPDFKGRSKTVDPGEQSLTDFNNIASSVKVPTGLVAVLYELADEGGGYGISVDLLEDHADLSQLNFNDKASYIRVFPGKNANGFVWARNRVENGTFLAGHWERVRASGAPVNVATAVLSPPLPPHAPGARPAPSASGPVVRDHRPSATPESILTTAHKNRPFDTSKPSWARDILHGHTVAPDKADVNLIPGTRTFSHPDYAKNEWTQIFNPDEDYEVDLVGLSGRAIVTRNQLSAHDTPFLHPFGDDWEFYIAPDAAFRYLAATPSPPDAEYSAAATDARTEFGLADVVNVLGVEADRDLVPVPYRALHGDRVAIWGRWIADAGHPDFHTEIHPPLLLATGRATSPDETTTSLIGRPYLVGQRFGGLGMVDHLLKEAAKIPESSLQIEAHPEIMPKAWQGTFWVSYTVRPPSPRQSPTDRLMIRFHFTVRSGVVVQVVHDGDAVSVNVAMNSNTNRRAALPPRHDRSVGLSELYGDNKDAGRLFIAEYIKFAFTTLGIGDLILARGLKTDRYDAPSARSTHDSEVIHVPVSSLSGNTPYSVDDGQPFPVYGNLTLTWERGVVAR